MGECEFPQKRLDFYIRAAAKALTSSTAAIENHFLLDIDHSPADLEFMFVDAIQPFHNFPRALLHAERTRLEEVWRNKLNASLNVKKQLRYSFSGFSNARHQPNIDADSLGSQEFT